MVGFDSLPTHSNKKERGINMANTPPKDKRFESGEIVFWCHQCGHEYSVHYGMVDEQYKFDKNVNVFSILVMS